MIDQPRRTLLAALATGGTGVFGGCADALEDVTGRNDDERPESVTLCLVSVISRRSEPHEPTVIVRDGDEIALERTERLDPPDDDQFGITEEPPIESSSGPFRVTVEDGDRSKTFDTARMNTASFLLLVIVDEDGTINFAGREESC